ncbi:MAG TPA: hypothetical protein VGD08_12190 [Stellaceae bacterium]|jgi:regulator of RNase E activity RraA
MTAPPTPATGEEAAALRARLARVGTCAAIDILRKHGGAERIPVERLVIRDVRPLLPLGGRGAPSVAGPARTLRFLPARDDVAASPNGRVNFDLIDGVRPGEVLVFDTARGLGGSVLGDMLALRAARNGAAGVVTDGVMRDLAGLASVGLPVFASGVRPYPFIGTLIPWEADVPIQCGGALVLPGDWILADADAVLVLPRTLAGLVADGADALASEEAFCRALLERGHPLREAYPMPPGLRPHYERYLRDGVLPGPDEVSRAAATGMGPTREVS